MPVDAIVLRGLISDIHDASLDTKRVVYTLLSEAAVPHFDGDAGILYVLDAIGEDLLERLAAVVDNHEFEPVS